MLITQIYNEFKNNLPVEQFEVLFEGTKFRIYFKDFDNVLQILVLEEFCIVGLLYKTFAVHYKDMPLHVRISRIFDIIAFLKEFAQYMERYVIDNTPKYGLVKLIQGEE